MREVRNVVALTMLLCGFWGTGLSQVCEIGVLDTQGAMIPGAHITVYLDPLFGAKAHEEVFETNRDGNVSFDVPDGFYDVCVMSAAFIPQCTKIRVKGHAIHKKFHLLVSPDVAKEIGDTAY